MASLRRPAHNTSAQRVAAGNSSRWISATKHPEEAALAFPYWSVAPFVVLLVSIAVIPLLFPRWWDKNTNKLLLSLGMSAPVLALLIPGGGHLLAESIRDYVSFIVIGGALFVISGGIYIHGEFPGSPRINTLILTTGALLANLIGTTGASMLLIRPYLRANGKRRNRKHLVIFFIFSVSNIGGLLTPLGDPPLFLGFLRGVPFTWTLGLWPVWATALGLVLIAFHFYDRRLFIEEKAAAAEALAQGRNSGSIHVDGKHNFLFLMGILMAAVLSGHFGWPRGIQELLMLAMAALSWWTTRREVLAENDFSFHPIAEVAAVFAGIFITMIPALEILRARAGDVGLQEPWQYFWLTGILSSFLDNAPTYLTFTSMALGVAGGSAESVGALLHSELGTSLLRAISTGAVFMGANSYIGNAPNFMVKSIAERHGVEMPSFGGYMVYSAVVLFPIFVLVTLIFFR